ncbi:MAG: site-specific integrase, partial [Pseudophaeobacter sp.]
MKIEISIDGDPSEFEQMLRMLLLKQITDSDITKAKQREEHWKKIEGKRPKNRKTGKFMKPRVFGYGSSTGYNTRWKTIC